MRILAYADRISVAPGESLAVKVSCDGLDRYDAELVRVIQGDTNPAGPGYREERIELDLGGPFAGRHQALRPGSAAIVEPFPSARLTDGLTLAVALWPTLPGAGRQTILAARDPDGGRGFELALDESGAPSFVLSDGREEVEVSTGRPLVAERWYCIAATVDPVSGVVRIGQRPKRHYSAVGDSGERDHRDLPSGGFVPSGQRLTIAARSGADGHLHGFFNGRIEAPRLLSGALPLAEALGSMDRPADPADPRLVAAWDFSRGIDTEGIADIAGSAHGRLVNLPTRGVTGRLWQEHMRDWRQHPEGYGAIHFHDDDLCDAGWETDFTVSLPELTSGVYAIRLFADGESYYVPFCLRAAGESRKRLCFLMPTASYLAYANNRIGIDVPETEIMCGRLMEMHAGDLFMQAHPELGLCFYDVHNDGSPVYYSSRSRPVVDMQPGWVGKLGGVGSNLWQFNADTHILGWLEHIGIAYDVVTDEDLHLHGATALEGYDVVITGSHPEYYSLAMFDGLRSWIEAGGRLIYMGGNGFYWRISFHRDRPDIIECRKSEDGIRAGSPGAGEYHSSLTGEYSGLWRRNGMAPNVLAGIGMVAQGFDESSPYWRTEASWSGKAAFAFEGIEADVVGDYGLSGRAAAGIEVDAVDHSLGTPPHTIVLASSRIHTQLYLMVPEDMLDPTPALSAVETEVIRSDMTFYDTDAGGAVFATGSIAWAGAMAWNGYDNDIAGITENVLRRFLDPDPF